MSIEIWGLLIIPLIAMITSLTISIIALLKSNQAIREKERPMFDIFGLSVDFSKLEVFAGTNTGLSGQVKTLAEFRNLSNYKEIINRKNFENNFTFSYNDEIHWIVNLIRKKTKPNLIEESVVIGFNALQVELTFEKQKIRDIELIYGFTLIDAQNEIPSTTRHSTKFSLNSEQCRSGKLTIPFTYASLANHKKKELLDISLQHKENKAPNIDVLTSENPMMWLGFKETGYVFRLTTTSNVTFDYSVIITVGSKKCYIHPISANSNLFLERAKIAKKLTGKNVIQKRPNKWQFWRR